MAEMTDPWKPIQPPDQSTNVSGRRVDPALSWDLFWGLDTNRNCLLILKHDREMKFDRRLPKLRGVEVETFIPDTGSRNLLVIRLEDNENREIFHRLCLDIIASVELAKSEEEAIGRFIGRTWRWHRLLQSGRDGRLSDEEQKGLLGELGVLQRILIPVMGARAAVNSWTGPHDAPKDFEVGRICIEAKARRGAATPHVVISSEHQLDTGGIDVLFLYVAEVAATSAGDRNAVTITDVARQIKEEIETQDVFTVELFEEGLFMVGFDWADDYSDKQWLLGRDSLFEVRENFPCVTPLMVPAGVNNVRYAVSLPDCEPFCTSIENLKSLISGGSHGNRP